MAISGVGTIFKKLQAAVITAETIATSDGLQTTFSGSLNALVDCTTVKINYKVGTTATVATTASTGIITGTNCTGTIDCKTGKWLLTFTIAPATGVITADYTQIAKVIGSIKSIKGPGGTRATLDTTALDTDGGYRTFVAGFKDAGELSLSVDYSYNAYKVMYDDFQLDAPINYELDLSDTDKSVFTFSGLVTGVPLTIPEDLVTFDVTIKISGKINFSKGV